MKEKSQARAALAVAAGASHHGTEKVSLQRLPWSKFVITA